MEAVRTWIDLHQDFNIPDLKKQVELGHKYIEPNQAK